MSKTHNLFISHSWAYSDSYDNLCNLLDKRLFFNYKNFSVPKNDPIHTNGTDKELLEAIIRKMQLCHVILILAGKYSSYSKWIKKEIIAANDHFSNPKPIIGIKPYASTVVSNLVRDNATEIINWNSNSIVEAIRNNSNA